MDQDQALQEPLAYRVARGGMWVAIGSYFNIGFGFIANLLLTRILAPEDFGIYSLAFFFFSLVNLRPKTGIGYAFAQRKETSGELVGTHLILDISFGLLTLALAGLSVPLLRALGYRWEVVWVFIVFALIGVIESFMGTAWLLLDKDLRFGTSSLVSTIVFPLSYLPAFWLVFNGGGYWSLVAQSGTYALFLLGSMWWAARRVMPHTWELKWQFDRRVAAEFLRFGITVGIATLAGMLLTQFDNFLVGTYTGEENLGFYTRAYQLALWPNLLVSAVVTRAAFFTYAQLQDDRARLVKTATMTFWLVIVLSLPLALAVFLSASDLITLLYTERWLPSALFLRFLIFASLLRPLQDNAGSLFIAVGKPRIATRILIIQIVILAVAGIILTRLYGAVGTSLAVTIAFTVGFFLTTIYLRKEIDLNFWDAFGVPALAAFLTIVTFLLLERNLDLNSLPLLARIILKGGYAAGVFLAIIFLLQPGVSIERARQVWQLLTARRIKFKPTP